MESFCKEASVRIHVMTDTILQAQFAIHVIPRVVHVMQVGIPVVLAAQLQKFYQLGLAKIIAQREHTTTEVSVRIAILHARPAMEVVPTIV